MAMNKKEQAEMAELKRQVAINRALNWTQSIAPDLKVPSFDDKDSSGFVFNAHNAHVQPAWSTSVSHGVGQPARMKGYSASQRGISMYSSKLLALRALRHEMELAFANRLADVDKQIEAEIKAQEGTK